MAMDSKGMKEAFNAGGRNGAVKYCQEWKDELADEGRGLAERLKAKEIDYKEYNRQRADLNRRTADLNMCIKVLNKAFVQ